MQVYVSRTVIFQIHRFGCRFAIGPVEQEIRSEAAYPKVPRYWFSSLRWRFFSLAIIWALRVASMLKIV